VALRYRVSAVPRNDASAIKQAQHIWRASVQGGVATLLSSEALEFEISQIPDEQRRREALAILTLASERLLLSDISEQLAESIASAGLSAMDALHVALAATARADYFVTADDKLLRKAKSLSNLAVKPVSVLELISEIPP
jgi:predicted nucleic acid-binding protein